MDFPRDNIFTFLFSTYRRTAAVGFAALLLIAIPVTLFLASKSQDVRQRASGGQLPAAVFDSAVNSDCSVHGWAYDPDNPSANVTMHYYRDGVPGTFVGASVANEPRPDVDKYASITGDHGFSFVFDTASGIRDGKPHQIYIYAIDNQDTSQHTSLDSKTITCSDTTTAGTTVTPISTTPTTSHATSVIFFQPENTQTSTQCTNTNVDVMIDPGKNYVTIIKLSIAYDSQKLQFVSATPGPSFGKMDGFGTASDGFIKIAVDDGGGQNAVHSVTKVATLTFKPLSATSGGVANWTNLAVATVSSTVLSIGPNDLPYENVLSSAVSGKVTIGSGDCPKADVSNAVFDLNDDGKINAIDFNILYSGFLRRQGD